MADSKEEEQENQNKAEKEEQARKAHALAEKCFLAGNVKAARMWMRSAVRLAPDLPGTPQIVAAYDVHAAAARSGRRDWYRVLGLKKPAAGAGAGLTHDDIKRQHRRLCLLVHPDKNPSAAADGAFKLIQAAWEALLAAHPPPLGAKVHAPPSPPSSPEPEPEPQPKQGSPPPPDPEPMPRPGWMPEAMPRPASPPKPDKNRCPACGAHAINGRNTTPTLTGRSNYRCMSCRWSPMDDRHDPDEDDYDWEYEYEYDDTFDFDFDD